MKLDIVYFKRNVMILVKGFRNIICIIELEIGRIFHHKYQPLDESCELISLRHNHLPRP